MCYSAMVEQSAKSLGLRFQARLQLDLFEELFRRRLEGDRLRIPKAMERDFLSPESAAEERIRDHILAYREQEATRLSAERERQRERLAAAERSLSARATKRAAEERRIAASKVGWLQTKLEDLTRERPVPADRRVFPQWFAPAVVSDAGERVVRPMRYLVRPRGKPATFDRRFPGLYNARRDNLTGFWREQFGVQHAVMVVTSFFENVPRHAFEHRALGGGEREQNVVVEFSPRPAAEVTPDLTVACLWDHWVGGGEPDLWSFAAITDDPPAEVRATGHDRCIVALRAAQVPRWLAPASRTDDELLAVLADREPLVFEHRARDRDDPGER